TLIREVTFAKCVIREDVFLRGDARNWPFLPCEGLGFPPRTLRRSETRGRIFVEDNDDALEKWEVSLKGLEETDVSSVAATCAGYEEA
ncbi:hypothetical protein A2U01_0076592, partial [Trifolium medium]|nr:hypothetical protein [Trifolium medium]